jgi:glycosyltransferase involved in cell wall biosynthesis/putative flippase GtrA
MYQFSKKIFKRFAPASIDRLAEKHKIGIKYVIAGGTSAVVDLGLLYIFTEIIGLWYLFSAAIAFIFGLLASFTLHKFWTFREHSLRRMKKQFIFFSALSVLNVCLNIILLYLAVDVLHIWYMAAQFVIMGMLALLNFALNKTVTFRHENKTGKNILIATGIYPPDIGGPATYTKTLYEELPKLAWGVKVITYSDMSKLEVRSKKSENIYCVSRKQSKFLRYFKYFWQVLKLLNWANTVYVQGPVSEGWPVYWACKLRGRRYILKVVGDYAWEQFQNSERRDVALPRLNTEFVTVDEFQNKKFDAKTERKRKIEQKVAQNAYQIIVPSEYLKKIVMQWGVAAEKITVVYNAVEFQDVQAIDKPAGEKWLVSVGRLVPWKGMDTLIEIMPALLQLEPNLKLKIIGDGPEREKLEVRSKKLEVNGKVRMLGRLTHEQTLAYLKAADVFVLNTGYEGLPHTVLEAMYCGVPVITTPSGGNGEVIQNGSNGLLVEYNNLEQWQEAILKLLRDENLVRTFVQNAKENLIKFQRQMMIETVVQIFSQLMI